MCFFDTFIRPSTVQPNHASDPLHCRIALCFAGRWGGGLSFWRCNSVFRPSLLCWQVKITASFQLNTLQTGRFLLAFLNAFPRDSCWYDVAPLKNVWLSHQRTSCCTKKSYLPFTASIFWQKSGLCWKGILIPTKSAWLMIDGFSFIKLPWRHEGGIIIIHTGSVELWARKFRAQSILMESLAVAAVVARTCGGKHDFEKTMIRISYHFFIPCHNRLHNWSIHWLKGLASNLCYLSSFNARFSSRPCNIYSSCNVFA